MNLKKIYKGMPNASEALQSNFQALEKGSIEESGRTVNGEYVRFTDGTQICWHNVRHSLRITETTGSIRHSNPMDWRFPKPFATDSKTVASVDVTGYFAWASLANSPEPSKLTYRHMGAVTSDYECTTFLYAIGRWK